MPKRTAISKILIIGSGPIVIGRSADRGRKVVTGPWAQSRRSNVERLGNILRTLLLICLMLLSAKRSAEACVLVFPNHIVKSSFSVSVTVAGLLGGSVPLAGAEVSSFDFKLKEMKVASALSDEQGNVNFRGLRPGSYFIPVKQAGIEGGASDLTVSRTDRSAKDTLQLAWPRHDIFHVRNLAGRFDFKVFDREAGDFVPKNPFGGGTLALVNAPKGSEVTTSTTDSRGAFAFATMPKGLYVLHLVREADSTVPEGIEGNIFVELTQDAPNEHLPRLGLSMSNCGMGYTDMGDKSYKN